MKAFKKLSLLIFVIAASGIFFTSLAETSPHLDYLKDAAPRYLIADYDKYNSNASENGLAGTLLEIEGIVNNYINKNGVLAFILTQNDGNEWLIITGYEYEEAPKKFNGYEGKEVLLYGEYQGFSGVYNLPAIYIKDQGGFYVVEDDVLVGVFTSEDTHVKEWMKLKAPRVLFSNTHDYESCFVVCEGLVTNVSHNNYLKETMISFVQKNNNDVGDGIISCKHESFPTVKNFKKGDSIELYYGLSKSGDYKLLFVEIPEKPLLTFEEYENAYRDKCVEYTYKGIARNPEKVKGEYAVVTGEVIQVLENGNFVELRVNITEEKQRYKDTVYVSYTRKSVDEDRILEEDVVTIWGKINGLKTYKSTLGKQVTLPWIEAEFINIDTL